MLVAESTIGPYTLVRSLGRGGFGEVWLAERRSSLLTTQVALKLPIVAAADIEQIRQEAQVWLQASGHPNIVPVLDAEVYGGQVVIASEFIAGGTLAVWLEKHEGGAPSAEAAAVKAGAILAGLDYLHRAGLVHRDLKPDNVLLQDGAPRLTDFGLARFVQAANPNESISGTPRYMAPESFSGDFSTASDLWSVGVIFYEMLAGAPPFPQQDIMELVMAIRSHEPAPLSASVPERYRQVVRRLLAKSRSDRFAGAAEALAELQQARSILLSAPIEASAVPPKHNLPVQLTSFIGRDREQAEIVALLEKTRLLTLTGSGGCGKTRLALQIAERALPEYDDGVWLAELAPLAEGDLVARSVASALEIAEAPGQPLLQTLTAALRSKRLLLLLDNCEHLLPACVSLATALLRGCPNVRIIATSREPLNVTGEQTFRVPSLALPGPGLVATPEGLQQYEGVRLFVERANASAPDFRVTSENADTLAAVCRRLDGIPLAIELAAARTRSMTVEQIALKLDDRFRLLTGGSRSALPRQQTLRSLIDWSYGLLTEPERVMLRRLSVFSGGWSLEAAEAVCSGGTLSADGADDASSSPSHPLTLSPSSPTVTSEIVIEEWEVLDLLTALGDKSLVVSERCGRETRYRMLESVREYSAERAEDAGETAALRGAHRRFYLALAEEAEPHFTRPEQGEWLARLDLEHDNLRAALDWCRRDPEGVEAGLRLSGALWRFWHNLGYHAEGREQLSRALARTDETVRTLPRAKALNGCALLAWCRGDLVTARRLYEESLAVGRELGDLISAGGSLIGLGLVHLEAAEIDAAHAVFEESRALCARTGDRWGEALSLNNLGLVASARGDRRQAQLFHQEALAIRRAMEDRWGVSMSLNNLGSLAAAEGDFALSRTLHVESLTIRQANRDRAGVAYSLEGFAALAARAGNLEGASCILGAAETLRDSIGAVLGPSVRAEHRELLAQIDGTAGPRPYAAAWERGRAMSIDQATAYVLSE